MKNLKLKLGAALLIGLLLLAVSGPFLSGFITPGEDPMGIGSFRPYEMPSADHWLGTDFQGRDGLAVLLNSIWVSLVVGLIAGTIGTSIGVFIGFVSGYTGGKVDTVLRIITDMVLVFPTLPLLLILALYIDRWSIVTLGVLLGAFAWAFTARIVRAQVLSLRERPHVDLARLSGESDLEIIFLELLPGLLPFIGYSLSVSMVYAMLAEAGLQFIGIGAAGLSTLGFLIANAFRTGLIAARLYGQLLLPAGILILFFLSLNLINIGLEEVYNPRLRTTIEDK